MNTEPTQDAHSLAIALRLARAQIRDLQLQLAETQSQKWQPIETAPKDGRDVLLYDLRGRIHIGSFRTDVNDEDGASLWLANDYDDYSCGLASTPISATHWLPLPEPPTEDKEQPWPRQSLPNMGIAAVFEWQPSWKHHHMPMWFKKAVRQRAINRGEWKPGISWAGDHLPSIFDHWGSFLSDPGAIAAMPSRKVAAMPYGANDDRARAFASEIGCNVECLPRSPWHPATRLYIFSDNQTGQERTASTDPDC